MATEKINPIQPYLTINLGDEYFAIPVLRIKDIFVEQRVTYIPLAGSDIIGAINLRGRIIIAIDLRKRFGLPDVVLEKGRINIAVEYGDEICCVVVDSVGDVISIDQNSIEPLPPTLDPKWKSIATGVHKINKKLLIVLNIDYVIQNGSPDY